MQNARLRCAVFLDVANHLLVLAHCLSPGGCGVEPVTIGTGYIGDVPDSVGTSTILQRTACHSVSEAFQRSTVTMMRAGVVIAGTIVCASLEGAGGLVPHVGVHVDETCLRCPLFLYLLVVDGIKQTCAVDADGRLQTHLIVSWLRVGVEGVCGDGNLRIDQRILLAVGECHRQTTGHHRDVLPLYVNQILVDRSLKGRHCLCLGHARHFTDVARAFGGVAHAILGEGLLRMIDDKQIAVAYGVGAVLRLALAVSVTGMTGDTAVAYPRRTKTATRRLVDGVEFLEERLAYQEVLFHTGNGIHSRSRSRVAGFLRRTQFAARIPLVGTKHIIGFAKYLLFRGQNTKVFIGVVITGTC